MKPINKQEQFAMRMDNVLSKITPQVSQFRATKQQHDAKRAFLDVDLLERAQDLLDEALVELFGTPSKEKSNRWEQPLYVLVHLPLCHVKRSKWNETHVPSNNVQMDKQNSQQPLLRKVLDWGQDLPYYYSKNQPLPNKTQHVKAELMMQLQSMTKTTSSKTKRSLFALLGIVYMNELDFVAALYYFEQMHLSELDVVQQHSNLFATSFVLWQWVRFTLEKTSIVPLPKEHRITLPWCLMIYDYLQALVLMEETHWLKAEKHLNLAIASYQQIKAMHPKIRDRVHTCLYSASAWIWNHGFVDYRRAEQVFQNAISMQGSALLKHEYAKFLLQFPSRKMESIQLLESLNTRTNKVWTLHYHSFNLLLHVLLLNAQYKPLQTILSQWTSSYLVAFLGEIFGMCFVETATHDQEYGMQYVSISASFSKERKPLIPMFHNVDNALLIAYFYACCARYYAKMEHKFGSTYITMALDCYVKAWLIEKHNRNSEALVFLRKLNEFYPTTCFCSKPEVLETIIEQELFHFLHANKEKLTNYQAVMQWIEKNR